jgi:hypothetical protein
MFPLYRWSFRRRGSFGCLGAFLVSGKCRARGACDAVSSTGGTGGQVSGGNDFVWETNRQTVSAV